VNTVDYQKKLRKQYGSRGLVIFMVNVDPFVIPSMTEIFRREKNLGFDIYHDADGITADRYGVSLIPTQFVIDSQGVVRFIHIGFDGNMVIENEINSILNDSR
jgi:peroxiredoxin